MALIILRFIAKWNNFEFIVFDLTIHGSGLHGLVLYVLFLLLSIILLLLSFQLLFNSFYFFMLMLVNISDWKRNKILVLSIFLNTEALYYHQPYFIHIYSSLIECIITSNINNHTSIINTKIKTHKTRYNQLKHKQAHLICFS